MKKILLGTTAIVAAVAFAAPSFAADPVSVSMGGFMRGYIGNIDHNETADNTVDTSMWTNSKVTFKGSTTLDNGVGVGVNFTGKVDGGDGWGVDTSYLTVSSDQFGALTFGAHAHRMDGFATRAPVVGPIDFGDIGDHATGYAATAGDITDFGDKTIKVGYVSPTLSGFSLYLSYGMGEGFGGASNGKGGSGAGLRAATEDTTTLGLAYEGEFNGAGVTADIGTFNNNDVGADMETIRGGLSVSMDGITFGGAYTTFESSTSSSANDGDGFEIGVAYAAGAYEVGLSYMAAQSRGTAAIIGNNEDEVVLIGATYDLGAGVGLSAEFFSASADSEGGAAVAQEVSGLVGGIEISF